MKFPAIAIFCIVQKLKILKNEITENFCKIKIQHFRSLGRCSDIIVQKTVNLPNIHLNKFLKCTLLISILCLLFKNSFDFFPILEMKQEKWRQQRNSKIKTIRNSSEIDKIRSMMKRIFLLCICICNCFVVKIIAHYLDYESYI